MGACTARVLWWASTMPLHTEGHCYGWIPVRYADSLLLGHRFSPSHSGRDHGRGPRHVWPDAHPRCGRGQVREVPAPARRVRTLSAGQVRAKGRREALQSRQDQAESLRHTVHGGKLSERAVHRTGRLGGDAARGRPGWRSRRRHHGRTAAEHVHSRVSPSADVYEHQPVSPRDAVWRMCDASRSALRSPVCQLTTVAPGETQDRRTRSGRDPKTPASMMNGACRNRRVLRDKTHCPQMRMRSRPGPLVPRLTGPPHQPSPSPEHHETHDSGAREHRRLPTYASRGCRAR